MDARTQNFLPPRICHVASKATSELRSRLAEGIIAVDTQEHLRLPEAALLGGTCPPPPGGRLRVMGGEEQEGKGSRSIHSSIFFSGS